MIEMPTARVRCFSKLVQCELSNFAQTMVVTDPSLEGSGDGDGEAMVMKVVGKPLGMTVGFLERTENVFMVGVLRRVAVVWEDILSFLMAEELEKSSETLVTFD